MKKAIVLLLIAAMTLSLAACGNKKKVVEENKVIEEQGNVDGGGITISQAEAIELPEGVKEAYESAIAEYTDTELTTIAYLGSQVVAGTNYKCLVREEGTEEDAFGKVYVVVVYEDLEGKAEVTEMTQVDFSKYYEETKKLGLETLVGGWNVDDAFGAGIEDLFRGSYDKAVADYKDYELEPICLLNFDVTTNMVYMFLCKASDGEASGLCVVTVADDFLGNSELTCVNAFE